MRRVLELAERGWGQTAPNPMVGAVVVRDGRVVAEGYHARFGEAHAEVAALKAAGDAARGATLYVNLEPCRHHGKTPPCTDAILAAGVARVVIGATDPTSAGGGAAILARGGVRVETGLLERQARELNAAFFHAVHSQLPWTTLKLAVSVETAIADSRGSTTWLTGAESRREVHRLRAGHDAVAVGVGTIVADDARLTVRDWAAPRRPPARVIFDRSLRIPPTAHVVATARETPTIVVTRDANATGAEALRDAGVRIVEVPGTGLGEALRALREEGLMSVMIEGGAAIASAALAARLVNRMVIFQAPVALGRDALYAFEGAPPSVLNRLEVMPALSRRLLGRVGEAVGAGGVGAGSSPADWAAEGPDVMTTYAVEEG